MMVLGTAGEIIADVLDTPGVHGVALVPGTSRAFASNGQANNVTAFDLDTADSSARFRPAKSPMRSCMTRHQSGFRYLMARAMT